MAIDVTWLPTYPDRLWSRSRQSMHISVQNLDPLPNALPPTDLTWHPSYPDRIWANLRRPALQPFRFTVDGPPFAGDVYWRPIYPDRIPRPSMQASRQTAWFGPAFNFLQVPITMGWRPQYPDRIWRTRPVPPTQTVYPIQGATILGGASCVEWADETVDRPLLEEETFTRPGMACTGEGGGGFLLLEDGGFLLLEDGGKILLEDQSGIPCETFVRPMMTGEDWC